MSRLLRRARFSEIKKAPQTHTDPVSLVLKKTNAKEERPLIEMPVIHTIRTLYKQGSSKSKIARDLNLDRKTVRKYLEMEDLSPPPPVRSKRGSILDEYEDIICGWLKEDQQQWRKQRHSAKRIWERLRDEYNFTGSYETVQKRVKELRKEMGGTSGKSDGYLQLEWPAGSMQVDFGEVRVTLDGHEKTMHALVCSFPHSNVGYAQVFGGETAECVCQGLRDVFEHIGGVPPGIIFDNATGIGRRIGDKITKSKLFAACEAHYGFNSRFCNPYSGNEKGNVERMVYTVRAHLFVPVPEITDIYLFNKELLERSFRLSDKEHYRKEVPQLELFAEDRNALDALPPSPFEARVYERRKTDKYGNIQLDGCHIYSVGPGFSRTDVLVEIGAHEIHICNLDGQSLATHQRQFGSSRTESIDPAASVAALSTRPGAWEQSLVRKAVPDLLRDYIDATHGAARHNTLDLLATLNDAYGFQIAIQACVLEVKAGHSSIDFDSAWIRAGRLAQGKSGDLTSDRPSLNDYDALIVNARSAKEDNSYGDV